MRVDLQGVADDQGEPVLVNDGDAVHEGAVPYRAGGRIPLYTPPSITIDGLVKSAACTLWAAISHQRSQPVSPTCTCSVKGWNQNCKQARPQRN